MKKFLVIIILGLCFVTPSQANDIRDFQIEGISVHDNLLDFFSIEEINKDKNLNRWGQPKNKKYKAIDLPPYKDYVIYDSLSFNIDKKTYEIFTIIAGIYLNDIKNCKKEYKNITDELNNIFKSYIIFQDQKKDNDIYYGLNTVYDFDTKKGTYLKINDKEKWADASANAITVGLNIQKKKGNFAPRYPDAICQVGIEINGSKYVSW